MEQKTTIQTMPMLSSDRIDQMIALACSLPQEARAPSTMERFTIWLNDALHGQSRRFAYGIGATAVSASCIAAFWLLPSMDVKPKPAASDVNISEYLMQDLLDDLT